MSEHNQAASHDQSYETSTYRWDMTPERRSITPVYCYACDLYYTPAEPVVDQTAESLGHRFTTNGWSGGPASYERTHCVQCGHDVGWDEQMLVECSER